LAGWLTGRAATLALAAGDLGGQGLEPRRPEVPERIKPRVDVAQRARADGIQAPGAFWAYCRESGVAQYAQVLGDARLGDPEFLADCRADLTGAALAIGEELKDPAPHWVAKHIERVHTPRVSSSTYISED